MLQDSALGTTVMELVQRLNPDFLKENADLIAKFMEGVKESGNSIKLEEYGLESPDELLDLVNVVPKYNDLIDDYEELELAFESLQNEVSQYNHHAQGLQQNLSKVEQEKHKYLLLLKKSKQQLNSYRKKVNQLQTKNQALQMELSTKSQLLEQMRYLQAGRPIAASTTP